MLSKTFQWVLIVLSVTWVLVLSPNGPCRGETFVSKIHGTWQRDYQATKEQGETESGVRLVKNLSKRKDVRHLVMFDPNGDYAMTVELNEKEVSRFVGKWNVKEEQKDKILIHAVMHPDRRKGGGRKTPIRFVLTAEGGLHTVTSEGKCRLVFRRPGEETRKTKTE